MVLKNGKDRKSGGQKQESKLPPKVLHHFPGRNVVQLTVNLMMVPVITVKGQPIPGVSLRYNLLVYLIKQKYSVKTLRRMIYKKNLTTGKRKFW